MSEAHHQHQNFAENRIGTLKSYTNRIMDRSGCPPNAWLLCLMYVCFLLNHIWHGTIKTTPLQAATGSTCDISALLCFAFWEPVYYRLEDSDFGTESSEGRGHFVSHVESVPQLCSKCTNPSKQKNEPTFACAYGALEIKKKKFDDQ